MSGDPLLLTADQLLKARAIDLFRDEGKAPVVYRGLALKWHPDRSAEPNAVKVFAHVTQLYHDAKRAWVDGTYPNTLKIVKSSGTLYYPYLASLPFELGELYICERHVIWATRREYDDLAKRWLDTVKTYKFPNDVEKARVVPFVPKNSHTVANGDRAYTIVDRPADYIRLIDILAKKGPLDPRHVCWVLSRAYQLGGFLEYCGITHFDISPETFFVEPATHFGALLGGWFYTQTPRAKALALPGRTSHLLKSEHAIDSQIRLMGRHLLGATSGVQLRARTDVGEPLKQFLRGTPTRAAIAQKDWRQALSDAYGKRTFTELPLTTLEIYN